MAPKLSAYNRSEELLAASDKARDDLKIAHNELFAELFAEVEWLHLRIEQLEGINEDHQATVAALQQDKAYLIRELTKAQAKGREADQQHCTHGVPMTGHWMHQTGRTK